MYDQDTGVQRVTSSQWMKLVAVCLFSKNTAFINNKKALGESEIVRGIGHVQMALLLSRSFLISANIVGQRNVAKLILHVAELD